MVSLPKIKVGRKSKRNYFDMSHDVNTTADFGFCQPTLCQELIPDSKIDLETKSFVRLAPLPVPTFGRIKLHQVTRCIPVDEVQENFANMIKGQSYRTTFGEFTPTSTDQFRPTDLFKLMFNIQCLLGDRSIFRQSMTNSDLNYSKIDLMSTFFRVSVWTDVSPKYHDPVTNSSPADEICQLRDMVNDPDFIAEPWSTVGTHNFLYKLISNELLQTALFNVLSNSAEILPDNFIDSNGDEFSAMDFKCNQLLFSTFDESRLYVPYGGYYSHQDVLGLYYLNNMFNMPDYIRNTVFSQAMSLENADFIYDSKYAGLNGHSYDDFAFERKWAENPEENPETNTATPHRIVLGIHLTPAGKRIFKILRGLGYNIMSPRFESLNPLFSYYKSWFDTYNPGRDKYWKQTNCYKLIHTYYDTCEIFPNLFSDPSNLGDTQQGQDYRLAVLDFISDLAKCVYSLPVDQFTVCTATAVQSTPLGSDAQIRLPGMNVGNRSGGAKVVSYTTSSSNPYGHMVYPNDYSLLDALQIRFFNAIYPWLNKFDVSGGKLEDYMKAKYGISLPPNHFVGSSEFMFDVSDVLSTAETSDGYLGEYAGKGIGSGKSEVMHYETDGKTFCYLIQFACVVPYGGYCQGSVSTHIRPNDFYQSEFDSLGKEAVPVHELCDRYYFAHQSERIGNTLFGFRPRFMHMKVKSNLANGGFALRSMQNEFLPYSLDRLFSTGDYYQLTTKGVTKTGFFHGVPLACDESLRFIGLNESYGNYDRIFYDNSGATDNFIITMYQNFKMYSPMKPVSESFDAFDKDSDDDVTKVEHA